METADVNTNGTTLVQTDRGVRILFADGSFRSIDFEKLWPDAVDTLMEKVRVHQNRSGFFPMSPECEKKLRLFLHAYLAMLPALPEQIRVPVFAQYNYAFSGLSEKEENEIPKVVSIPFEFIKDVYERAADVILGTEGLSSGCCLSLSCTPLADALKRRMP